MAIKIKKNGVVQDLVINANEVRVLDTDGNFRSKNLESVLKELNATGGTGTGGGGGMLKEAEYVFVGDTEPDYEGVWLDTSEDSTEVVEGDNSIVKAIRDYIDTDVKTTVEKNKALVQENNKIVKDIQTNVGNRLDVVPQLSNPNLLINGDFRNPVNQRNKTVYDTNGYCIDRWILWNANTTLTVNKGYCTLAGNHNTLVQHIEFPTFYSNKKVTLTARVRGAGGGIRIVIYSLELEKWVATEVIDTTDWKEVSVSCIIPTLTNDSKRLSVSIEGAGANSIDIEWVKLELGDKATPFYPRSYGEELALCQRYYEIVVFSTRVICATPNNLAYELNSWYKADKRISPSQVITQATLDDKPTTIQVYASGTRVFGAYITTQDLPIGSRITYVGIADAEIY